MPRYINVNSALQAHPEFLNEQIDDHDKAVYAKGWNACNSAYYSAIKELPFISSDEVRCGTWVGEGDGYDPDGFMVYDMWSCGVCGERFEEWDEKPTWNYCPNCGAKMEVSEDA